MRGDKQKVNEAVNALKGKIIVQRTPTRVVHRRTDKLRERRVIDVKIKKYEDLNLELLINAESGTYIKELINGDNGRTKPNLSELLGMGCIVKELDVTEINEG